MAPLSSGDLVDFVDEDDARLLNPVDRGTGHTLHVDELLLLFLRERLERRGNFQASLARLALEEAGQHVLHVDVDFFDRRTGNDLEGWKALFPDVDFDLLVIEPSVTQPLP